MTVESSVQNLTARFLLALGHELGAAQAAYTGPLSTLIDFRRDLSDDEVDLYLHTIDTQTARLTARSRRATSIPPTMWTGCGSRSGRARTSSRPASPTISIPIRSWRCMQVMALLS